MQGDNPYSAPNATLADVQAEGLVLAGRGMRLLGAIIDSLLLLVILVPIMFMGGFISMMMRGEAASMGMTLGLGLVSIFVFLVIQSYPLRASGQTWAKKWLGMKIVDMDGRQPEFLRMVGLRYVLMQVINMLPFVGGLFSIVDALFIFGDDRRCLHDKIAGTQVVVAN